MRIGASTRPRRDASWSLLCVATITVTWMAVRVTALATVSDVLLVCSIAAAGPRNVFAALVRIPSVVIAPVFVLVLLEALHLGSTPSEFIGLRMATALIFSFLAMDSVRGDQQRRQTLTHLFAYGAAISGAVAVVSRAAGLYLRLPGVLVYGGREVGFTNHPNHLGLTCLLGLSVALFSSVARERPGLRVALIIALGGGLLVSGSRAALVGACCIGLAAAWANARKHRPELLAAICLLLVVGIAFGRSAIVRLSALDRLLPSTQMESRYVTESNDSRLAIAKEAFERFSHSPLIGSGLDSLRDAHNVYLQILTSGGIVFLLSLVPLIRRAFSSNRRRTIHPIDPNAAAVAAWLVAGIFTVSIFDRYLYIPLALAVAGSYWPAGGTRSLSRSAGSLAQAHPGGVATIKDEDTVGRPVLSAHPS